jgi:hypothetical protein
MTTATARPPRKGPIMHQHDSAAARAMRIRRTHDMEATELDTMHRRGEAGRLGLLARFLTRLPGRTRVSESPEQLPAIESAGVSLTSVESAG